MTKTYEQVMKQIHTLSQEAEKLKRKEIEGVISRMKEAIRVYGLTAEDLGLSGTRITKTGRQKPAKKQKASKSKAPKYRDEAGNTWGGRGPRPLWLREALANGKQLGDFAV